MIKEDLRERFIKGRYSVKHVGVGATTPDRLCSTDPKRRASLDTYDKGEFSITRIATIATDNGAVRVTIGLNESSIKKVYRLSVKI